MQAKLNARLNRTTTMRPNFTSNGRTNRREARQSLAKDRTVEPRRRLGYLLPKYAICLTDPIADFSTFSSACADYASFRRIPLLPSFRLQFVDRDVSGSLLHLIKADEPPFAIL